MSALKNTLRGIAGKISDKDLQDLISYFNNAEKYISELEMVNLQLTLKINTDETLKKKCDDFVFYAKNGLLDFHEPYRQRARDLTFEINEINNKIKSLQK